MSKVSGVVPGIVRNDFRDLSVFVCFNYVFQNFVLHPELKNVRCLSTILAQNGRQGVLFRLTQLLRPNCTTQSYCLFKLLFSIKIQFSSSKNIAVFLWKMVSIAVQVGQSRIPDIRRIIGQAINCMLLKAPELSFRKKKLLIFLFHFIQLMTTRKWNWKYSYWRFEIGHFTGLFSQNFEAIIRFRRGSAGY